MCTTRPGSIEKLTARSLLPGLLATMLFLGPVWSGEISNQTPAHGSTILFDYYLNGAGACWAEDAALAPIELERLLKEIFLAYGGRDSLAKFNNNYILIGDQTQPAPASDTAPTDAKAAHFRQVRKGSKLKIEIEPGGDAPPVSTVYDGMSAWKSTAKLVEELPPEQAAILKSERDHQPSVLTHFSDPNYSFHLDGRTTFRATPVYSISIGHEGADPVTVFVDEKNYLVIGITYKGIDPQTKVKSDVAIEFSQYRPASGTLFPFKQTQYVDDKPVVELNVANVDSNVQIDDAQFRRPDKPNDIRLAKPVVVPFDYSHKEILVKVRINDSEPLDFLFDTAASQTVIDRRTAAENFLDKQGNFNVTAAGGSIPTQMTTIKKMDLGDAQLSEVQALMLDLSPQARQLGKRIAGILGANVLDRFAVTLDFAKNQITLHDADTYKPPQSTTVVPFSPKGPTVKASINNSAETSFLIDTGAAFNNIPSRLAKPYLAGQTPHMTEGTGLDGRPVKLATITIGSVKIGGQIVKNVNFTYAVEPETQTPGQSGGFVQSSNVGVLGNPFWQHFQLTMDYRFQRLVLQPNTVQSARQEIDQLIASGDSKLVIYRDLRATESAYERALLKVQTLNDPKLQARIWGRIGNLRRVMAKDLNRPEQARIAYEYFSKAQELAHKLQDKDTEGRVLADWSLLYLDNGQVQAAQQALQGATLFAPQDPQVNIDFAVYLYKLQMYPDMQKYIEKALFLDPANWQALWYKVKLAEIFSDNAQLKETLKEILKAYPWSKVAKDKLTALTAPPVIQPGLGQTGLPPATNQQTVPVQVITPSKP